MEAFIKLLGKYHKTFLIRGKIEEEMEQMLIDILQSDKLKDDGLTMNRSNLKVFENIL